MIFEDFSKIGIIPIVELDTSKSASLLAKVLCENGLPCAEVTFSTSVAEESIKIMTRDFPDMLVGAGTVLTIEQADRAIDAGAKFIVSPGLNPKIVQHCLDESIPVIPGAQTPTEMERALELGLKVVKFFPAEPAGGLNMIKAVAKVYTDMRFMPSGGINTENVRDYLAYDKVVACGSSWMVNSDLVNARKWDKIAALVKEAAGIVTEVRVKC